MAVLQRRGVQSQQELQSLLQPDPAPEAKAHFPDLECAVQRLLQACREGQALAVCGDYDADGMTSTALLVGVLSRLGPSPKRPFPAAKARAMASMPPWWSGWLSRASSCWSPSTTASAPAKPWSALRLCLEVIVTDHHTIPPQRPPLLALLHPALTPPSSPIAVWGVGLAYVLAAAVAERLRNPQALRTALDLFCIGTIADMAPLTGVNRRWLQEGLPQLHRSALPGLRALAELSGLEDRPIDSQGVGFRLAPRLNAVGRLADPQLAVELLTTSDADRALELAERCEQLNRQRRELCDGIEAEANALVEADGDQRPAFLLLAQNHWHHGVIGIVAARLVERWGLPVALLAGEGNGRLRSSVRAPEGFAVDAALQACGDLLERFGGHPAAGGFTVQATEVAALHERLTGLANDWLAGRDHALVVRPEALLPLEQINRDFLQQLRRLEPFGAANPSPLFWARHCQVKRQRLLRGGHLLLELAVPSGSLSAIAWRWSGPEPTSQTLDLAFRLKEDHWQGQPRLQLELEALRPAMHERVTLWRRQRCYQCERQGDVLVIRNPEGRELRCDWPQSPGDSPDPVQSHPDTAELVQHAALALGFVA